MREVRKPPFVTQVCVVATKVPGATPQEPNEVVQARGVRQSAPGRSRADVPAGGRAAAPTGGGFPAPARSVCSRQEFV
eukprot:3142874-Lingulodinium_polyedra.AAC.1